MPSYTLRPDGTVTNQWSIAGALDAHSVLGRAVSKPSVPANTQRVGENVAGEICEVSLASIALADGEVVTSVTLEANVDAPSTSNAGLAQIYVGATALGSGLTWTSTLAQQWLAGETIEAARSQSDLDDMRVRLTKTNGGIAALRCFCCYVVVATEIESRRPGLIL